MSNKNTKEVTMEELKAIAETDPIQAKINEIYVALHDRATELLKDDPQDGSYPAVIIAVGNVVNEVDDSGRSKFTVNSLRHGKREYNRHMTSQLLDQMMSPVEKALKEMFGKLGK